MPAEKPSSPHPTIAGLAVDDSSETRHPLLEPDRRRDRIVRAGRRRQMAAADRARGRRNPDAVFLSGMVRARGAGPIDRAPARAAPDRRPTGAAAIAPSRQSLLEVRLD